MRQAAHDLGNLLTRISGQRYLAAIALGKAAGFLEEATACLSKAHHAEGLAMEIVRAMQRDLALDIKPIDLAELLRSETPTLLRILGDAVIIKLALPVDLPMVLADSLVLQRVFANLADNARVALEGVATPQFEIVARRKEHEQEFVAIEVHDNGCGIPAELLAILNDGTECSTKNGHAGIGLGMIRKGIGQFGGTVEIRSEAGNGTTFVIGLPAADGK